MRVSPVRTHRDRFRVPRTWCPELWQPERLEWIEQGYVGAVGSSEVHRYDIRRDGFTEVPPDAGTSAAVAFYRRLYRELKTKQALLDLSDAALARAGGVSPLTVHNFFAGRSWPQLETIWRLLGAAGDRLLLVPAGARVEMDWARAFRRLPGVHDRCLQGMIQVDDIQSITDYLRHEAEHWFDERAVAPGGATGGRSLHTEFFARAAGVTRQELRAILGEEGKGGRVPRLTTVVSLLVAVGAQLAIEITPVPQARFESTDPGG